MNGVYNNRRNGHKATTENTRWSCTCGEHGTQKDDQHAQFAASFHVRHPHKPIPTSY